MAQEYDAGRLQKAIGLARQAGNKEAVAELQSRLDGLGGGESRYIPEIGATGALPGPSYIPEVGAIGARPSEDQGSTLKATGGALASVPFAVAGRRLSEKEEKIEKINNFQRTLFEQLPDAEQQRVKSRLKEMSGKEVSDIGKVPSPTLREVLEENPENEDLLDRAAGKEWRVSRKEFYKRLGNKILTGASPVAGGALNIFGAEDPQGALTGRGQYLPTDSSAYGEGEAPWYPGASEDAREWEREADSGAPGIYEHVIKPALTSKDGISPGKRLKDISEDIIKKTYSPEQQEERKYPFLSPDVEIKSPLDIFNPRLYTDPKTKLPWNNLEAWFLTFVESSPEIAVSIGITRSAGRMAAARRAREMAGDTLANIEKARKKAAMQAGVLTGTPTEGYIVAQHVSDEARNTLMEVPLEKYREDETFQEMVAAGMTEEAARQVLATEAGSQAGQAAFVSTAVLGAPMSTVIAKSGAGALVRETIGKTRIGRGAVGALGEGLTEGLQEVMEQYASDVQVARIDPDNPIFSEPNRYANLFAGGVSLGAPMGALAVTEAGEPSGYDKVDIPAAKATAEYMQAANERFKYETKITDPEFIKKTAPIKRLEALERLEHLQEKESDALIAAEPKMRSHLEEQGTLISQTELKMLDRLKMKANAIKTDIAVARSKRTTATQIQEEERRIVEERQKLREQINEQFYRLEDLETMASAIETVQDNGAISNTQEDLLVANEYAKRVGEGQRLIITPKGRRAVKNLKMEAQSVRASIDAGYAGPDRRQRENLSKRSMIEELGPAERESVLYNDPLTQVQNRRAFNERQENIDVRGGQEKRNVPEAAPVVAAVDVDSLAWVNDNMSHGAGDRLLIEVADAIGEQAGVEVYRLGGDEFAVTGQSEQQVEAALQAAVKRLQDTPIIAGQDEVTPTITWGKGATYEEADAQSVEMKRDRQRRGVVGKRKEKPASYRVRSQKGLFQMDRESPLPRVWSQVRDRVKRGDVIEILTPDGATMGVITEVKRRGTKSRLFVSVHGRQFKFNPERNWLVPDVFTDPADIAYITGNAEYAQPDYGPMPQTIPEVYIGHIGTKSGEWFVDLGREREAQKMLPLVVQKERTANVPFVQPPRVATDEEMIMAHAIIADITDTWSAGIPINIVKSIGDLEKVSPEVVAQMRTESRAGPTSALYPVRGYMDHINPKNGVYIFVGNIAAIESKETFAQGIIETVSHELIGHYGVRGFFGNEPELRAYMNDLVDSFPRYANHIAATTGLNKAIPEEKQVLGEEMFAYLAGEVESGKIKFNQKQKTLWQKIIAWIQDWLKRRGWEKYSPLKRATSLDDTKEQFWNDSRVQQLMMRSQDFLRSGRTFDYVGSAYMRDADIFRSGTLMAMERAVEKISKGQRKNMAQQKGVPVSEIPAEVPLFPESASPNKYIQSIDAAKKQGWMTERELELLGLSPESDWYLFDDATYGDIAELHKTFIANGNEDPKWYQDIVPHALRQSLDDIMEERRRQWMNGPLPQYAIEADRPTVASSAEVVAVNKKLEEVLSQKIDKKNTTLTKDLLKAHLKSDRALSLWVERVHGLKASNWDAARRIFGPDITAQEFEDDIMANEIKAELVKEEVKRIEDYGYDIGYDKRLDHWFDFRPETPSYANYISAGSNIDNDYRVALVKTSGAGTELAANQHYSPNIMHIRTGLGELLQGDDVPNPELEWLNESQDKRLLAMIELQSDQGQRNRRGFASGDDRMKAATERDKLKEALQTMVLNLDRKVDHDIASHFMETFIKPIANLPSEPTTGSRGSNFNRLEEMALYTYNDRDYFGLSEDNRLFVYNEVKREMIKEADDTIHLMKNAIDAFDADVLIDQTRQSTLSSADARQFARMDAFAARQFKTSLEDHLTHISNNLAQLRHARTQADVVRSLNDMNGMRADTSREHFFQQEAAHRVPVAGYLIEQMIEKAYEAGGIDIGKAAEAVKQLESVPSKIYRLPKSVIEDFNTARIAPRSTVRGIIEEMLAPSALAVADIPAGSLNFMLKSEAEFIDITVTGDEAQINVFEEKWPILVANRVERGKRDRDYVLQNKLDAARSTSQRQPDRISDVMAYSELEEYLGLEEIDTTGEPSPETINYGVQTYYEYEEDNRLETEEEIRAERRSHMDWDTEDDGALSRNSDEYRSRLYIDDDGDVDNSDAEDWLRGARDDYLIEGLQEEIFNEASDRMWDRWNGHEGNDRSALIVGSLPTEWDEDGDPIEHVEILIVAKETGDSYDVMIDDEEYDYGSTIEQTKSLLDPAIARYYERQGITPPVGKPYGTPERYMAPAAVTPELEEAEAAMAVPQPNWDIVTGNIVEGTRLVGEGRVQGEQAFRDMVTLNKKIMSEDTAPDHPLLNKDEVWRTIALKYLISDAVRRGLPGIFWNNGLASAGRGGMGIDDATRVSEISWVKEKVTLQGKEQEVYMFETPDLGQPLAVAPNKLIEVFGSDVRRMIHMQEAGKIPDGLPGAAQGPEPEQGSLFEDVPKNVRDQFLVAQTDSGVRAVYRRNNNAFLGLVNTDEDLANFMRTNAEDPSNIGDTSRATLGGEVLAKGKITGPDVGGDIWITKGRGTRHYSHTFAMPRLAGARKSYEEILVNIWNKELKKYGGRIETAYITDPSQNADRTQGQPSLITNTRDALIEEQHGSLSVQEVRGEHHGWIVVSEKRGPVFPEAFATRAMADQALKEFIDDNFQIERRGIKVFFIRVNDKMREEFSKPVAPFHREPSKDPAVKGLLAKIGHDKKDWRQRYAEFRHGLKHEMAQGMLDRFYGLRKALNEASVSDSSYIDARLTTSLDSLMKGVVEYGAPVWRDGVVRNEGKGLAEVLAPIMNDPDTWGGYMVAKRAKDLMLEGWDSYKNKESMRPILEKISDWYGIENAREIFWKMILAIDPNATFVFHDFPRDTPSGKNLNLSVLERQYFPTLAHHMTTRGTRKKKGKSITEGDMFDFRIVTRKNPAWNRFKKWNNTVYDLMDTFRMPDGREYDWAHTGPAAKWREILKKTPRPRKDLYEMPVEALKAHHEAYPELDFTTRQSLHDSMMKHRDALLADGRLEWKGTASPLWGIKTQQEAERIINTVADAILEQHNVTTEIRRGVKDNKDRIGQIRDNGREHTIEPHEIEGGLRLAEQFPHFREVARDYAAFNKAMLDFGEASGIINKDTRPTWESADYVPFYRIVDDRIVGGFSATSGIANQRSPIKRLSGKKKAPIEDIINSIFMNATKIMDASVKNNAAMNAIDALNGSGFIAKAKWDMSAQMIPGSELKKVLVDWGIDPAIVHPEAFKGLQKMFAVQPPEGPGYISILRNGKKEYYYTDEMLLYRALSAINMKQFGAWIQAFRFPKKLLTEWITIDPSFVIANLIRDTGSSFVIGRDWTPPILGAGKGFSEALFKSEAIRTLTGAGGAFENGYTTANDPNATKKLLRRLGRNATIAATVLDTPAKLYRAWRHITTASENANRVAIYHAAKRAGKSEKRAIYEAKDLMDFSMGGDWPFVQFLIQTVPFMNARAQGMYRLGRGFREHPVAFTVKGTLVGMAGWVLYMAFREDERYQELEMWDKQAYFHWWIGDEHYRLPKPFEVGAIFNTIPEMATEAMLADESDAGKELAKGFAHMFGETFSMNPIPQTAMPIIENLANYNFFTGRPVISYYEQRRKAPEQYRYRTSPTMIELSRQLPEALDVLPGHLRSPLALQNAYLGYTGTLGRYLLMGSDAIVRTWKDYPNPPSWEDQDWPVWGRFIRGDSPARRTKYETEVYRMLDKVAQIQGSLSFLEKTDQVDRYLATHEGDADYIRIGKSLESVRENIQDVNTAIMQIYLDKEMSPQQKTEEINLLQETRNELFREGYKLRPGGEYNPLNSDDAVSNEQIMDLIDNFGVDDSNIAMELIRNSAPDTAQLIQNVHDMSYRNLASLARLTEE